MTRQLWHFRLVVDTSHSVASCGGPNLECRLEDCDWRHAHQIPRSSCRAFVDEPKLVIIPTWRTVGRLDKTISSVILPICAVQLPQVLMTSLNFGGEGILIGSVGFEA